MKTTRIQEKSKISWHRAGSCATYCTKSYNTRFPSPQTTLFPLRVIFPALVSQWVSNSPPRCDAWRAFIGASSCFVCSDEDIETARFVAQYGVRRQWAEPHTWSIEELSISLENLWGQPAGRRAIIIPSETPASGANILDIKVPSGFVEEEVTTLTMYPVPLFSYRRILAGEPKKKTSKTYKCVGHHLLTI